MGGTRKGVHVIVRVLTRPKSVTLHEPSAARSTCGQWAEVCGSGDVNREVLALEVGAAPAKWEV